MMHDGAAISVRRHGNPEGPRIDFSHGNGLAADAYFPFQSGLLSRFALVVFDFRSHGRSPVGDLKPHNLATFIRDFDALLLESAERFGAKPAIGVFHSLSALTALLYAQRHRGFSALVLFDPPVLPPGGRTEDDVKYQRGAERGHIQKATVVQVPRGVRDATIPESSNPARPRE